MRHYTLTKHKQKHTYKTTQHKQGLHHEFDMGGGDGIGTLRGTASPRNTPPTPNFGFLLGFRPLYFAKRHANLKKTLTKQKIC